MKKIYCIILFLGTFYSNSLFSQSSVYNPFPENYGRWEMTETNYKPDNSGDILGYVYYRFEVDGDTTINSINYKKVISSQLTQSPALNPISPPFGPKSYSFAYRNDIPNKKVYILKYIDGIEIDTLWYDFNLAVGDTIDNLGMYSFNGIGMSEWLKFVDSAHICNDHYKTLHFNNVLYDYMQEAFCYLTEGVGFNRNFIQSDWSQFSPFENTRDYTTTFYCTPTSIDEINTPTSQIEVFPNPVENTLQIKLTGNNTSLFKDYSIMDCLGRVVCTGSISDNSIDVSMLEKGLYFIQIQDKEKNIFQGKFVKQ